MDPQRPPAHPLTSDSSTPSSTSSVPSLSSASTSTDDRSKSPFSTSPSGRVSFVFPHSRKSPPGALAPSTHSGPFVSLPSAEFLPLAEPPTAGEHSRVVLNPNRLRLITDDTLSSILGPVKPQGSTVHRSNGSGETVQSWITSTSKGAGGSGAPLDGAGAPK